MLNLDTVEHKIFLDRDIFWHQQDIIYDWCCLTFGETEETWRYSIVFGHGQFFFKNREDAILFKLTWCFGDDYDTSI